MKSLVTLFLFALYTFINGISTVHASGHTMQAASFSTISNNYSINFTNSSRVFNELSNDGGQADHVIAIQEDDDQDELNKAIAAARVFVAFYHSFFLGNRYAVLPDMPSVYEPLYYLCKSKFIAQRVLRI